MINKINRGQISHIINKTIIANHLIVIFVVIKIENHEKDFFYRPAPAALLMVQNSKP